MNSNFPSYIKQQSTNLRTSQKQSKVQSVSNRSYFLQKHEESFMAAADRLAEFFSSNQIKKLINYDEKSRRELEMIEDLLKQIQEFVRKKSARLFQEFILKENDAEGNKKSIEKKFQTLEQIIFRKEIMEKIMGNQVSGEGIFENYDPEDEILDQLEATLMRTYSEL